MLCPAKGMLIGSAGKADNVMLPPDEDARILKSSSCAEVPSWPRPLYPAATGFLQPPLCRVQVVGRPCLGGKLTVASDKPCEHPASWAWTLGSCKQVLQAAALMKILLLHVDVLLSHSMGENNTMILTSLILITYIYIYIWHICWMKH